MRGTRLLGCSLREIYGDQCSEEWTAWNALNRIFTAGYWRQNILWTVRTWLDRDCEYNGGFYPLAS